MATITLEYNQRNGLAQKTLNYILSLGIFKTKEEIEQPRLKAVERSLAAAERGEIYEATSVEDLFRQLESDEI